LATKTSTFTSNPNNILIMLKRNDGNGKNVFEVNVSQKIVIGQDTYTLNGMVLHFGDNVKSGHYVAISKRRENFFFLMTKKHQ
jgi:hypothetical protein